MSLAFDQFILFGDSITNYGFNPEMDGWAAYISHAYQRRVDVINRGFSGYCTEWSKHLLSPILKSALPTDSKAKVLLVTIFLGANDAVVPEANPRQAVSLEQYKANLHMMLDTVKKDAPHANVVLITPPPVYPSDWEAHCIERGRSLDRTVERTRSYRDACASVYEEAKSKWAGGIILVDTWKLYFGPSLEWNKEISQRILNDGLHLAAEGNKLLGNEMVRVIGESWPELSVDDLGKRPRIPTHDTLDVSNLPASLFINAL